MTSPYPGPSPGTGPPVTTTADTALAGDHTGGSSDSRTVTSAGADSTTAGSVRPGTGWQRARRIIGLMGMQPAGWALLVLVVALAVSGGLLGWLELRVMAVVGLVVLLCAIGFTLGRQTYAVTLRLQRRQVVVGERALGDLIVENTSNRRLLPARIELPVGRRIASFGLPTLGPRASHDEVFAVPTARRSVIRIGPARSVRGDPFGLMGKEVRWTGAIELYVHPRTVRIPGRTGGFIRDLEGYTTAELTSSDVSFHALREYVAGDDRRHVHWRSSAKLGELMVRQFEETRRSHVAIALDLDRADHESAEEFELAVSVTGSLAVQAQRDENNVAVLTTGGRLRAVNAKRTLDELSAVESVTDTGPSRAKRADRAARRARLSAAMRTRLARREARRQREARDPVLRLAREVQHAEPNASLVSLVTGSRPSVAQLHQAGTTFDPDVRVLLVRVELGAELSVQTIGSVSVVTLGDLDDLPRGVRRATLLAPGGGGAAAGGAVGATA